MGATIKRTSVSAWFNTSAGFTANDEVLTNGYNAVDVDTLLYKSGNGVALLSALSWSGSAVTNPHVRWLAASCRTNPDLDPYSTTTQMTTAQADALAALGMGDVVTHDHAEYEPAGTAAIRLPSGMIMLWSGSVGSIPTGWVLCDGSNGTPDLRNKFIVGAGSTYAVADAAGAATHTHSDHSHTPAGTVAAPTFTGAPATLTHTGTAVADHSHTPAGTNAAIAATATAAVTGISLLGAGQAAAQGHTHAAPAFTGTPATLTHGVTQPTAHNHTPVGTNSQPSFTGNAATLSHSTSSNLPPYYALAYVMKT